MRKDIVTQDLEVIGMYTGLLNSFKVVFNVLLFTMKII